MSFDKTDTCCFFTPALNKNQNGIIDQVVHGFINFNNSIWEKRSRDNLRIINRCVDAPYSVISLGITTTELYAWRKWLMECADDGTDLIAFAVLAAIVLLAIILTAVSFKLKDTDYDSIRASLSGVRDVFRIHHVVTYLLVNIDLNLLVNFAILPVALIYGFLKHCEEIASLHEEKVPAGSGFWLEMRIKIGRSCITRSIRGLLEGAYSVCAILNIVRVIFDSLDLTTLTARITCGVIIGLFMLYSCVAKSCDKDASCFLVFIIIREMFVNGGKNPITPVNVLFLALAIAGISVPWFVPVVLIFLAVIIYGSYLLYRQTCVPIEDKQAADAVPPDDSKGKLTNGNEGPPIQNGTAPHPLEETENNNAQQSDEVEEETLASANGTHLSASTQCCGIFINNVQPQPLATGDDNVEKSHYRPSS